MSVTVGPPEFQPSAGVWSSAAFPGHADQLLAALDPTLDLVVLEGVGSGRAGWHEAQVSLGGDAPSPQRVRGHSFDLLLTPARAVEAGPSLRGAGLFCWQAAELPQDEHFRLEDRRSKGFGPAMAGLGIALVIDLPHDAEVAVVTALSEAIALGAGRRLREAVG